MDCVIFDIDGTLAEFDAPRLGHLVHGTDKQWDAFHDEMHAAAVIGPVARLAERLRAQGEAIVRAAGSIGPRHGCKRRASPMTPSTCAPKIRITPPTRR